MGLDKYPFASLTGTYRSASSGTFSGISVASTLPGSHKVITKSFTPVGPWKTPEAFAMRRIRVIQNGNGEVVAFRPVIQQGNGGSRHSYSTVFRINRTVSHDIALKQAMLWRDAKEANLGIVNGARCKHSSEKFIAGLSLVVTKSPPYRAAWTSAQVVGGKRVRVYIGRRGYQEAYECAARELAALRGVIIKLPVPCAPYPQDDQYVRLQAMNIKDLPNRRKKDGTWDDLERRYS